MKKVIIALLVMSVIAAGVFATGKGEQAQPVGGAGGPVSILIHPTLYEATGGDTGVIHQFSQTSGIEVTVVTAPTEDLWDKALIEFLAKSGRFDVVLLLSAWLNDDIFQYLEPLDGLMANASPGYDKADLIESLVKQGIDSSGALKAVPMRVGTAMFYYNKEMLRRANVAVPKTWDEVMAASAKLTQGDVKALGQTFGPTQKDFFRILYSMGGTVLSDDMTKATVDTPQTIMMIDAVKSWFDRGYISRESLAWDRDPQITALQQGRMAMGVFYSPYWGRVIDPTGLPAGVTPDTFGWALSPTSPGVPAGRTMNDGWSVGIDKNSKNKANAWKLVEALTNKENQLTMALHHANGPTRTSTYQNQEYIRAFPLAQDWLTATAASLFIPAHPDWEQIQDVYNQAVFEAIDGRMTPKEAAVSAQTQIQRILDRRN